MGNAEQAIMESEDVKATGTPSSDLTKLPLSERHKLMKSLVR